MNVSRTALRARPALAAPQPPRRSFPPIRLPVAPSSW